MSGCRKCQVENCQLDRRANQVAFNQTGLFLRVEPGLTSMRQRNGMVGTINVDRANAAGIFLRLQHDVAGYQIQYLHLSAVESRLRVGSRVTVDSLIGRSGATGAGVTGADLHFEASHQRLLLRMDSLSPKRVNDERSENESCADNCSAYRRAYRKVWPSARR